MTSSSRRLPEDVNARAVQQALALNELKRRGVYKPTTTTAGDEQKKYTERYSRDLIGFCTRVLGMTPWKGVNGQPGQYEVLQAIQESVCRQLDGEQNVPFIFVVEAGHGVGKPTGWKRRSSRGSTAAFSPLSFSPPPTPTTRCATPSGRMSAPTSRTRGTGAAT